MDQFILRRIMIYNVHENNNHEDRRYVDNQENKITSLNDTYTSKMIILAKFN